jgi:ATP-dependent exoDNAse (exonuclease V) beta subunit
MNEALRQGDARAREQALDPSRSFIVQAPAGSGKTELLTQRYLVLLATVDHPEEILAVTFTNKAASEMRDRVLKALARAADDTPPEREHERRTWLLARRVRSRDRDRHWRLEENPRRLRVQTIDSLCASLTRALPLAAGFGAMPSIVDDASEHYREAARATLALVETDERWSEPLARLIRHLDGDLGRIEMLIADMLARRDQWLRHVTRGVGSGEAGSIERAALERALENAVREALEAVSAAVPGAEADEIGRLAALAGANLARTGAQSPLCACAGLERLPEASVEALPVWLGIAELLLTKEGAWRTQLNKRIGLPPEAKQAKESLEQLLARLAGDERLRTRLHALRALPALRYSDEQWALLEALAELLPLAAAQLELVFRRRGEVDFLAVAHGALAALGAEDEPSELALKLDYRLRHILVDEFQDTSLSQFQLLERLTAGWEPGDGRTLFLVGDPMQSIYRFREAEVGLYLRARQEGIGTVRLEPLQLAVNFRSQAALVEWCNATFPLVMPKVEDASRGAVPYTPAEPYHPALAAAAVGTAVTVHAFFGDDANKKEAERVIEVIRAARADNPRVSIALLVRARGHLDEIVPRLRAANIRYVALDIEPLGHRPAIQDLYMLTRALEHPADRLAWLAVLRAPWCGLALADLAILAEERTATLWEAMNDKGRIARLSTDGRARVERQRAIFGRAREERRRRGLARAVEGLWLALGGPACLDKAADLEDAERYFELIAAHVRGGGRLGNPMALETQLARLYALPEDAADPAAVQIMTMHKAKGLEFDVVLVPGLGRAPARTEKPLLRWFERPRAHGTAVADLVMAPILEAGGKKGEDEIYAWLERLDAERGAFEDGRLLYVAATRARQRLHLFGHTKRAEDGTVREPEKGSLLRLLWPAVRGEFESAAVEEDERSLETHAEAAAIATNGAEAADPPSAESGVLPGIKRLALAWRPPPPPSPPAWRARLPPIATGDPVEFGWAGETARHVGTVVHRYLLRIAREGVAEWPAERVQALEPAFRRALAELGVPPEREEEAVTRVREALLRTLGDPRGRWLLSSAHREARSEYALGGVLPDGRLVEIRIDRTFVDENGTRWIVDYKTGTHEGGDLEGFLDRERERYAPQLERYALVMRALDPARPIRFGLYFPLLGGWREWAYDMT